MHSMRSVNFHRRTPARCPRCRNENFACELSRTAAVFTVRRSGVLVHKSQPRSRNEKFACELGRLLCHASKELGCRKPPVNGVCLHRVLESPWPLRNHLRESANRFILHASTVSSRRSRSADRVGSCRCLGDQALSPKSGGGDCV